LLKVKEDEYFNHPDGKSIGTDIHILNIPRIKVWV